MKTQYNFFQLFLALLFICTISSCNDDNKREVSEDDSFLTETKLPPGKTVIEENNGKYVDPATHGPLGNNDSDEETKTSGFTKTRLDTLKQKFKNLLVFHADDTMQVNKPRLATLILANDRSIPSLKKEVIEESDAKDDNYKVDTSMEFGSKMKARLISFGGSDADNSFEIVPQGEDIQKFNNNRKKIIWQWKITPLKPGQQSLKLFVQIIGEDDEAVTLGARSIDVIIFAKPESFWKEVGTFLEGHQWLFSVLLLPILVAWFTTRMKNKATVSQSNGPSNDPSKRPVNNGSKKRKR